MEENLILEGFLSMVTELKEKQEQQITPTSRGETTNRLDVIGQRILEIRNKSGIPKDVVQEVLNQIGSIKKGPSENRKKDLQDVRGMIVALRRYFKGRLKISFLAGAQQPEKAELVSRYDKILDWITLFQQPKFFLFSAGIITYLVSLVLNFRFAERMQQLQDNNIRYRYLLMRGEAKGSDINLLGMNLNREWNSTLIQNLTDPVKDFEYRNRKQARALGRVRLLNEQTK